MTDLSAMKWNSIFLLYYFAVAMNNNVEKWKIKQVWVILGKRRKKKGKCEGSI